MPRSERRCSWFDSLRLHAERGGEVSDTQFVSSDQGVQKPKAGVVRQDLEHGCQPARLNRGQQGTFLQGRFRAAMVFDSSWLHFSPLCVAIPLIHYTM